MGYKVAPTTDLYFLHSCKSLVAGPFSRSRPIERLGANSFKSGKKLLIIRSDTPEVVQRCFELVQSDGYQLYYLIDDNSWHAVADDTLDEGYRNKLVTFHTLTVEPLIQSATKVLVSSRFLLPFVPKDKKPEVVRPVWPMEPPPGEHFRYAADYFSLAHLGTNSHRAGFDFIIPIVEKIIARHPQVHFTYNSNKPLLGALDRHPRVKRKNLLRWSLYKNAIGRDLYHLALYPIMDTPLNQGRSINKILEHPLNGCSALYSDLWTQSENIEATQAGLCLPNDPEVWIERIGRHIKDTDFTRRQYHRAMHGFYQLNSLSAQRDFWRKHFIE